jgi:hypothetical protein
MDIQADIIGPCKYSLLILIFNTIDLGITSPIRRVPKIHWLNILRCDPNSDLCTKILLLKYELDVVTNFVFNRGHTFLWKHI